MNRKIRWIRKTECYRFTWFSRVLILVVLLVFSFLSFDRFPNYLSKSNPVQGEFLVLDGLLPDYVIHEAIDIFNSGAYKKIIVSGGDLPTGFYLSEFESMADLSYATLVRLGFDANKLIVLPTGNVTRDRTYTSGLALKNWFLNQNIRSSKVDVLSMGFHTRRSEYLFQQALGKDFTVGAISIDDVSYDKLQWWKSSKGTRTVISELIGYFYAVFFFSPS